MALTGRFWFRRTWTGKMILLVQEEKPRWFSRRKSTKLRWRDATLLDMAEPALRPLMGPERSNRADYGVPTRSVYAVPPVAQKGAPA